MHVAHGTYRGSVAGNRRSLAKRGSSGNLSVEGEDEQQPSPGQAGGASPGGSAGGASAVVLESCFRRVQHAVSVFIGLLSARHTDFLAHRSLLMRLLLAIAESVFIVVALTVIGTVIFSRLERDKDHELEVRYTAVMAEVRNGVSPQTYEDLLYYVQNPREGDVWALSHQSAYLFAFSTVTSIGYGVFTPVTQGGQVFFCFYALFCIPLCGISFGRVATSVVDLLSWFGACHRAKIRRSFRAADPESRGYITQEEMRIAIEGALKSAVDVTELEELVVEIDPDDTNRITLKMYAWAFSQLGSLDERALQKTHRVRLTAFTFAIWNIVGMIIFHLSEGWSWVESIYFCFETLLTIGLGDYVPQSTNGVRFQFIFCVLGLGMLASLITAIAELELAEEAVARAAVEALAREKLVRISETHSRGTLELSTPMARLSAATTEPDAVMERIRMRLESSESDSEQEPDAAPAAPAPLPLVPVAPAPPPPPVAPASPLQRQVPPAARFSADGPLPATRFSASGPLPLPSPSADVRLRPTSLDVPPWFVPQATPPGDPAATRRHSESSGLIAQASMARGAEERARARAERAARVAARREAAEREQIEEDALHANAARQHRRIVPPAEWSDA